MRGSLGLPSAVAASISSFGTAAAIGAAAVLAIVAATKGFSTATARSPQISAVSTGAIRKRSPDRPAARTTTSRALREHLLDQQLTRLLIDCPRPTLSADMDVLDRLGRGLAAVPYARMF